mmetsp:Transcript_39083/g.34763  ORF Transcript_39083/g.34763 Transcript_39083/m.34763 type:complete len:170 (-) Transcript_39083:324-833(-)
MKLIVVNQQGVNDKIHRPYLEIEYRSRRVSSLSENKFVTSTFETKYQLDTDAFWDTVITLFYITQAVIGICVIGRIYIWGRFNPSQFFPENWAMWAVSTFLAVLVNTWGNVMFYFLLVTTGYWFIFFKLQDTVYFMIPEESLTNEYERFEVIIGITITCHVLSLMDLIR